jgi:hypothetical protein
MADDEYLDYNYLGINGLVLKTHTNIERSDMKKSTKNLK